jgi:hypothetical protein
MPTHVVELLLGEHNTVTEVDEEFTGSIRTALKGLEHSP